MQIMDNKKTLEETIKRNLEALSEIEKNINTYISCIEINYADADKKFHEDCIYDIKEYKKLCAEFLRLQREIFEQSSCELQEKLLRLLELKLDLSHFDRYYGLVSGYTISVNELKNELANSQLLQ